MGVGDIYKLTECTNDINDGFNMIYDLPNMGKDTVLTGLS